MLISVWDNIGSTRTVTRAKAVREPGAPVGILYYLSSVTTLLGCQAKAVLISDIR